MHNANPHENISDRNDYIFHKGQIVLYKGREASVLDVKPVFIIRLKDTCEIICGDTLINEVNLYRN
jgi:hypothetical protein